MDLIDYFPKDFLTGDIWIAPTERKNILELNETGKIKIIDNTPIIKTVGTPSVKKTLKRLLYIIKDKMTLFNDKNNLFNINLINYIKEKYFDNEFKNYYRAKKAWYRYIGDTFKNLNENNIKKALSKILVLLKILNPVLVFEIRNISKWNYPSGFRKLIKYFEYNNISIVLKCLVECKETVHKLFNSAKINSLAIVKYYCKLKGRKISSSVAKYLLNISNGNINIIDIILLKSKREIRNLRELKIPWLKLLPEILPEKYKEIINIIFKKKKFKVIDLLKIVNLKISTIYSYLRDLINIGILTKRRIKNRLGLPSKTFMYKLSINQNKLFEYLNTLPFYDLYYAVFNNIYKCNLKNNELYSSNFLVFG